MEGEPKASTTGALAGLRVVSFESRRAAEMADLLRHHGAIPVSAPSMREVPLGDNPVAREFARRLIAGDIAVVVLLTGVGTRALVAAVEPEYSRERLARALAGVITIARGPKPVAALRELGLTPTVTIPEPNTWREILAATGNVVEVAGRCVAVQEYGTSNAELLAGLRSRGADVFRVPVYRWALPEDTRPLRAAVRSLAAGGIDVALFTSATQVEHMVRIADEEGVSAALPAALGRMVVASIGPVCSEALRAHRFPVDVEPAHPKMGYLVREAAARSRELLASKREQDLDRGGSIT
jgi:uroporphyrinogen-III synthase